MEMEDETTVGSMAIVGLGTSNIFGIMLEKPLRLISKFITSKCGLDYNRSSKSVFCQLAMHGDFQNPLTFVSSCAVIIIEM